MQVRPFLPISVLWYISSLGFLFVDCTVLGPGKTKPHGQPSRLTVVNIQFDFTNADSFPNFMGDGLTLW